MLFTLLAAVISVSATPSAPPTRPPVVWSGAPAAHLTLQTRPLGISPDGEARWLVSAQFTDARGRATQLLDGGDVAFTAAGGEAQWQTRLRFGAPSAIVSTVNDGPLSIDVTTNALLGSLSAHAATTTRAWHVARVAAEALGPHTVQLGWFPQQRVGTTLVLRSGDDGTRVVGLAGAPSSTFRDVDVQPGTTYRYTILRPGDVRSSAIVDVPPQPGPVSADVMNGKGMWLSFSPSTRDDDSYAKLDPVEVVDRAVRAGLRFIELRTAYGPYWEITPNAKPTIDAIIDLAAEHGIAVVGWTVPRTVAFEDLAQGYATASYSTPRGNHFAGLAIDVERGEQFMGAGARGYATLTDYLRLMRAALGRSYPLIAVIEDPYLEKLSNVNYPYEAIAANADVLQPMAYWRMLSQRAVTPDAVRAALAGSYAATLREAHRNIAINLGAQTSPEGSGGSPPPGEITAALAEAKRLGALGVTFFDWTGTTGPQWDAIGRYAW